MLKRTGQYLSDRFMFIALIAVAVIVLLGFGCSSAKATKKQDTEVVFADGTRVRQGNFAHTEGTGDAKSGSPPTATITPTTAAATGTSPPIETPAQIAQKGINAVKMFYAHWFGIVGLAGIVLAVVISLPFFGGPHFFESALIAAAGGFLAFLPAWGVFLSPLLFVVASIFLFAKWRELRKTRIKAADTSVKLDAAGDHAGAMNVLKNFGPAVRKAAERMQARARKAATS